MTSTPSASTDCRTRTSCAALEELADAALALYRSRGRRVGAARQPVGERDLRGRTQPTAGATRCASTATAITRGRRSRRSWRGGRRCAGRRGDARRSRSPGRDGELIQAMAHPRWRGRGTSCCSTGRPASSRASATTWSGRSRRSARSRRACTRHARALARPPGFARLTWDFETSLGDDGAALGPLARRHGRRRREGGAVRPDGRADRRRLARYGKGPDRFGLIHCDLRLANLLIDGGTVKVIDFDDCGFGWFMYDAATPVSFYEHEPQVPELIDAWVRGYRSVRAAAPGGRGRDPDLRHAAPAAAGRLDRLARRDRARAVDGRRLHGGNRRALRGVSAAVWGVAPEVSDNNR